MSAILDSSGRPMQRSAEAARGSFYGRPAYEAASYSHQDMAGWLPRSVSGHSAISAERDLIADRVQDIARNDGWASASISRSLDLIIGSGWRLAVDLPGKSLGLDDDQADEVADQIEEAWEEYANDPGFWCNASRQGPMASVLGNAWRHRIGDGEAFAQICWSEDRGAPFATYTKVIDPDRVSNPNAAADEVGMRSGIALDFDGAAYGYHVRTQHPDDDGVWGSAFAAWEFVERETEWGRPVMVHAFEADRAGQFRGIPPLAPILRKLKQMTKYDEAELQAALINSVLAAFIKTPNSEQLAEAMLTGDKQFAGYLADRAGVYDASPLRLKGGTAHFLAPGDDVTLTQPGHPNSGFEAFFRAALRNVASTIGLTYEQLSMDWSQVNYSSARAALLEVWRGLTARKDMFAAQFMNQVYRAWLEEAFDRRIIRVPGATVSFEARPAAWSRCDWIGPARGWVDPQKEAAAAILRMDAGMSDLEREGAEQGIDWKRTLRKQARIKRVRQQLDLVSPPANQPGSDPAEDNDQRDRRERQEAA